MKKTIKLTESDLENIIKRVLSEADYSTDIERPTSDRERDVKSMFGQKYGTYIPNDVIRYLRKSPAQLFKKLYEIYGDKAYDYLDKAKERTKM